MTIRFLGAIITILLSVASSNCFAQYRRNVYHVGQGANQWAARNNWGLHCAEYPGDPRCGGAWSQPQFYSQQRPSGSIVWVQPQQIQPQYVAPHVTFVPDGWFYTDHTNTVVFGRRQLGRIDGLGNVYIDLYTYGCQVKMSGAYYPIFFNELMSPDPGLRQHALNTLAQLVIDQGIAPQVRVTQLPVEEGE